MTTAADHLVLCQRPGRVELLTLNRPEERNALSELMRRARVAAIDTPLAAGLALERALFLVCFAGDDRREGTRAFLEKRLPEFSGP
jgi:enoyl-CoA hydratase/carnithine racemase